MELTQKAIAGSKDYRKGGWFSVLYFDEFDKAAKELPTFRCNVCFDHMSLFDYTIGKGGKVKEDIVCPTCKTVHSEVVFDGFSQKTKLAGESFLK
jgi:hypothetical protein